MTPRLSGVLLLAATVLLTACEGEDCVIPVLQPGAFFQPAPSSAPQELARVLATNFSQCLDQCCHRSGDLCNVMQFFPPPSDGKVAEPNCIVYRCDNVTHCNITSSSGVLTFAEAQVVQQVLAAGGNPTTPTQSQVKDNMALPTSTEKLSGQEEGTNVSLTAHEKETDTAELPGTDGKPTPGDKTENQTDTSKPESPANDTSSESGPADQAEAGPDKDGDVMSGDTAANQTDASEPEPPANDTISVSEGGSADQADAEPGSTAVHNTSTAGPTPPPVNVVNVTSTEAARQEMTNSTVPSMSRSNNTTILLPQSMSPNATATVESDISVTPPASEETATAKNATARPLEVSSELNATALPASKTGLNQTATTSTNSSSPVGGSGEQGAPLTTAEPPVSNSSLSVTGTPATELSKVTASGLPQPESSSQLITAAQNVPVSSVLLTATPLGSKGAPQAGSALQHPTTASKSTVAPAPAHTPIPQPGTMALTNESTTGTSSDQLGTPPLAGVESEKMPNRSVTTPFVAFTSTPLTATGSGNGTVGGHQTMDEARDRLATTATLVSALTIGCFFCLVAAVLVGKRVVDGWRKRHYSRIERDYLIDGMYHE